MKLHAYMPGWFTKKDVFLGEVIGYEDHKLYVQQEEDKIGRKPIMEIHHFDHKVLIKNEDGSPFETVIPKEEEKPLPEATETNNEPVVVPELVAA